MKMRGLTRLTNAHSKGLRHHKAATALHYGFYNICRINEAVRVTPAMAAGLTERFGRSASCSTRRLREKSSERSGRAQAGATAAQPGRAY